MKCEGLIRSGTAMYGYVYNGYATKRRFSLCGYGFQIIARFTDSGSGLVEEAPPTSFKQEMLWRLVLKLHKE